MPYKWQTDKVPMPSEYDKRRKLTEEDKKEIKRLYGSISQRKLAKMFGVSRRTIIFIGAPEKHEQNLKRRQERGGSAQYYSTEYNTEAQKKHRRYKTKVLKELVDE